MTELAQLNQKNLYLYSNLALYGYVLKFWIHFVATSLIIKLVMCILSTQLLARDQLFKLRYYYVYVPVNLEAIANLTATPFSISSYFIP